MTTTNSLWHWPMLARCALASAITALAGMSLSACSDDPVTPPLPAEAVFAEVEGHANGGSIRPFRFSQQWDASGNDYTNPCIAEVPDPTAPGAFIQIPFPGVSRGWGTATHWGRHAVEIHSASCVWDPAVGAIAVQGPANAVVANGDTVWGTYEGHWYLSPTGGGDFVGSLVMLSGTGRFASVTGETSLYAHDEPDGSGWDWGSGWIAY